MNEPARTVNDARVNQPAQRPHKKHSRRLARAQRPSPRSARMMSADEAPAIDESRLQEEIVLIATLSSQSEIVPKEDQERREGEEIANLAHSDGSE